MNKSTIFFQRDEERNLTLYKTNDENFDVLLTVHLSIFISVFNQLDAQNLFHSKFYFMPLHVSNTCSKHVEACNKTYCETNLCIKLVEY